MISVLVLSNREERYRQLEPNVVSTVGCDVELLRDENISAGIAAAYNRLAEKARYPFLCFVHDDILFHTCNWGETIISLLQNLQNGVVGVMGGRYKSAFGMGWRDGHTSSYRYQLKDGVEGGKLLSSFPGNEKESQVLCLDGAFLCCRKEVWAQLRFDEENFRGFHFYDIDFSFRASRLFTNLATNRVLIEHFSHGDFSAAYLRDSLLFDAKHAGQLPASLDPLPKSETAQLEGYALSDKLARLKKEGFPSALRFRLLRRYLRRHPNGYQLIRSLYFGFVR